eukprot:1560108-Rhodomonas_salina.1
MRAPAAGARADSKNLDRSVFAVLQSFRKRSGKVGVLPLLRECAWGTSMQTYLHRFMDNATTPNSALPVTFLSTPVPG